MPHIANPLSYLRYALFIFLKAVLVLSLPFSVLASISPFQYLHSSSTSTFDESAQASPTVSNPLRSLASLPEGVANNAVAKVELDGKAFVISFMGLGENKTWKDVHNKVWALDVAANTWHVKQSVPSSLSLKGRLASIAVGINEKAYLFGGYTVAEDHTEISSPDNFIYDLKSDTYTRIASTPVPTDDAVALVYQNRFIYLISGWHNDGNVNLVQVYDTETNVWRQASPFLGEPVFGHAGGIVKDKMLVCDGVRVEAQSLKRRTFSAVSACYLGIINENDPYKIDWQRAPHPTNTGLYRMASSGVTLPSGEAGVLFVGGSDNPYNYNGVGYNGVPSEPSGSLWFFDFSALTWKMGRYMPKTMDHRGLVITQSGRKGVIVGGMGNNQKVLNSTIQLDLAKLKFSE